jgi:hypothetical protein
MTFELLIEQRRHATGNSSQREIAILTDGPNDIPGLIQRADDQPLPAAATECQPGVTGPVARRARHKPEDGVYQPSLVTGDGRHRCHTDRQIRELSLLVSLCFGQALPSRGTRTREKKCGA